jgi:hypothetical protein
MIQIIFMVIGVVYLFRLIGMNSQTGSQFGLDAETLAQWQAHRRKQYAWMIAAGWGSFVVSLLVGAMAGAAFEDRTAAQIGALVVGLITMFGCYAVSAGAGSKAKEIEALKVGSQRIYGIGAAEGASNSGNAGAAAEDQNG